MRVSLIVPAAGLSSRFHQSCLSSDEKLTAKSSKLFYRVGGEPVLLKTLKVFRHIPEIKELIVAISPEMRREVRGWEQELTGMKVRWILGGNTRAESVLKELRKTSDRSEWIMVHDGARPMIKASTIRRIMKAAGGWDGVILAKKVVSTIKKVLTEDGHINETVDRESLYEAETPQFVRRSVLVRAYKENSKALVATDEAGLLEAIGARVRVLPHGDWNPKLTTLPDLMIAKAMTEKNSSNEVRVGIGFDTHRLVEGRKFYLGGVVIPSSKGSLGHSDGDALLHSVSDAILGAIGAGDIGEWFSDRDPKYKDIRSTKILSAILAEAKRRGWEPYHVDTNTILESPKLYKHKSIIRKSLAKCLGISGMDVSIKARTREGLGPEGEGLAVTCQAVVSMRKIDL